MLLQQLHAEQKPPLLQGLDSPPETRESLARRSQAFAAEMVQTQTKQLEAQPLFAARQGGHVSEEWALQNAQKECPKTKTHTHTAGHARGMSFGLVGSLLDGSPHYYYLFMYLCFFGGGGEGLRYRKPVGLLWLAGF